MSKACACRQRTHMLAAAHEAQGQTRTSNDARGGADADQGMSAARGMYVESMRGREGVSGRACGREGGCVTGCVVAHVLFSSGKQRTQMKEEGPGEV